jgi:hypothetical protein
MLVYNQGIFKSCTFNYLDRPSASIFLANIIEPPTSTCSRITMTMFDFLQSQILRCLSFMLINSVSFSHFAIFSLSISSPCMPCTVYSYNSPHHPTIFPQVLQSTAIAPHDATTCLLTQSSTAQLQYCSEHSAAFLSHTFYTH